MRIKTQEILNNRDIASMLNVSDVTVRNWIKAQIIPENPDKSEIIKIKNHIKLGKIEKLTSRANKQNSEKMFVPIEYIDNKDLIKCIKETVNLCSEKFSTPAKSVYHIALALLSVKNELVFTGNLPGAENFLFRRKSLGNICSDFGRNIKFNYSLFNALLFVFEKYKSANIRDFLGICYQSLLSEGAKSQKGSYYTPVNIVNDIIGTLNDNISSFLDPCCGTGSFLLSAAANKKLKINQIYGVDIDSTAVFIAKINLLLYYKNSDYNPNIFGLDTLKDFANGTKTCNTNFLIANIDAIATNPPWGANKNRTNCIDLKKKLKSAEIFSMFIHKSQEILKEGGQACFLLPQSFLNIKNHKVIRQIICSETQINSIKNFGKAFTGVFTPVIFVSFVKNIPEKNHKLKVINNNSCFYVKQSRFIENYNFIYDINVTQADLDVIEKIYSTNHFTLKNNSQWSLGIVTGNNNKFIKSSPLPKYEPVFRGSDIENYKLNKAVNFIDFKPENFQQVAKNNLFRANEKLIYKFISGRLCFAYDNNQRLTLNSANVLIPELPGYSVKAALALLNSTVFQYLFAKKISSFKVLRTDLEQFPFPVIDKKTDKKLSGLVDKVIKGMDRNKNLQKEIYELFDLGKHEQKYIEKHVGI